MNVYIKTLGCKLNQYDSGKLLELLEENEIKTTNNPENAKVIIINTCTVTHSADHKSRQSIAHLKKFSPTAKVVIMGCGAEIDAEQYKKRKEVDLVSNNEEKIIKYIKTKSSELKAARKSKINKQHNEVNELWNRSKNNKRTRAIIKIQNGCENFCSYCIIPFTRGHSINVSEEEIINEIKKKENQGSQEIVITGINIGAYGAPKTTEPNKNRLTDLLKLILEQTNIPRIRLSSIGPQYFTDKLIQTINNPRICQHLHLSIQSGSNNVLKKMNRPYSIESVIELVLKIRKQIPDIAITSDVIVGFPEETDTDFAETLQNLKKIKLAKTHIFPYSIRSKTAAALMPQIEHNIKVQRKQTLNKTAQKMRMDFIKSQIGKPKNVLFEFKNKKGFWEGYTDNYIRVQIQEKTNISNQIKEIELSKSNIVY